MLQSAQIKMDSDVSRWHKEVKHVGQTRFFVICDIIIITLFILAKML